MMKVIFILIGIVSVPFYGSSYCGWSWNVTNYYGTNETVDYAANVNQIYSDAGCELTYGAVQYTRHARIVNDGGVQAAPVNIYSPTDPIYSIQNSIVHSQDVLDLINQQSFDVNELCELMYDNPLYNGAGKILNLNGGVYFDIIMVYRYSWYNLQTGQQQIRSYKIRHRIYHGFRIKMNNVGVICSSKGYLFNELFEPIPLDYYSPELTSNTAFTYNQADNMFYFDQPSGSSFEIIMTVYFGSYVVERRFLLLIEELKEAHFTTTVHASGAITINSPTSNMNNYSWSSGGAVEYSGNGVIINGPNYFFEPSLANEGNNLMMIRTNNDGCISDWKDTVFYVTPIVSVLNAPAIDLPYTFGTGEIGTNLFSNIYGAFAFEGIYHAGCSNTDYTFSILNPQPGLTYEWKSVYDNSLVSTGTGSTFDVTTPDRAGVGVNLNSSVFSPDTLFMNIFDVNYPYHGILGVDVDLDGNSSMGTFTSGQIGKRFEIFARAVNVNGDESSWTKAVVGLVPSPLLKEIDPLCFVGNPTLVPLTDTPIYNDSIGYGSIRSTIWDVNMNGIFEWDGSVDSVVHNLINSVKYQPMRTQIIDSVKYFGYSDELNDIVSYYIPQVSGVCKSSIDTVFVVRKPIINLTVSGGGAEDVGQVVFGVVTGTFFDPSSDSIVWNWNDGSPAHYGDSNFHFLNDLQYYSLEVAVIDSFGCQSDTVLIDYWFVDGILSISEEDLYNDLVKLYPVPVVDYLIVETDLNIEEITVVNALGERVYYASDKSKIDCTDFAPGQYVVLIKTNGVFVNRKIMKL